MRIIGGLILAGVFLVWAIVLMVACSIWMSKTSTTRHERRFAGWFTFATLVIWLIILSSLAGCIPRPPPQPPTFTLTATVTNAATGAKLAGAQVYTFDPRPPNQWTASTDVNGVASAGFFTSPGWNLCAKLDGFLTMCLPVPTAADTSLFFALTPEAAQPPPLPPGRVGVALLEGRALADELGQWNAWGASMFWAIWGEQHDPTRLEDRNLLPLARHGADFVRILGMVGAESWHDRVINPLDPQYWPSVHALFDRLARLGLRAEVTLFADAQVVMPNKALRLAYVNQWADFLVSRRDRVLLVEVANEAWQNGVDVDELREYADILRRRLGPTLAIGLSALPNASDYCGAYRGSVATIVTMHYDRNIALGDGRDRPIRQPWGFPLEYEEGCGGALPMAAWNGEPIGPHSSVAEEHDTRRLAMAAAVTWVAQNAGYVYHAGAGIRGGGQADLARGRFANLDEYPEAILTALAAVRAILPPGLANCARHNAQWPSMPFDGFARAVDDGALVRAYAATCPGPVDVLALIGVKRGMTVTPKFSGRLRLYDPADVSAPFAEVTVTAGQPWVVPGDVPEVLVLGDFEGQQAMSPWVLPVLLAFLGLWAAVAAWAKREIEGPALERAA